MFNWIAGVFKQRLVEATQRMSVAETELSAAMAELTVSDRADKQLVGDRLRNAMAELVAARQALADLDEPAQ
jgi:uncharacterized protein (DUF3084 family)